MTSWIWSAIMLGITVLGWVFTLGKIWQIIKDNTNRIDKLEILVGVNKDKTDIKMNTNTDKIEAEFAHRTMLAECAKAFGDIKESLTRVETKIELLIQGKIKQ